MDRNAAKQFATHASISIAELTKALQCIKNSIEPEEYDRVLSIVGSIAGDIVLNLINPTIDSFPEIEEDIDRNIEHYMKL